MTTAEVEVRRWSRAIGLRAATVDEIIARHGEPHRRYHSLTHVMWVRRHIAAIHGRQPCDDLEAVVAAALFHDIVYDPRRTDNEVVSASVADAHLEAAAWTAQRRHNVVAMIEATAHTVDTGATSAIESVHDCNVLLDADLAILGAEPAAYAAYVHGVRSEYSHVDDTNWATGRAQVLRSLVAGDTIYRTDVMHADREARARANIAAELATLERR